MIFLLQAEAGKSFDVSQMPLNLRGTSDKVESEKLWRSGHMPVSRTPMMTSSAYLELGQMPKLSERPRKCGVRVVWRWRGWSGITERIPGCWRRISAWSGVR